jgi:hypothetical protein
MCLVARLNHIMKIKKVVALFYNQERNGKNAREHNFLNFNFFGAITK